MLKRVLTVEVIDDSTHETLASLNVELKEFLQSSQSIRYLASEAGQAYFAIESHGDAFIEYVQLFSVVIDEQNDLTLHFDQDKKFIAGQDYSSKVFFVAHKDNTRDQPTEGTSFFSTASLDSTTKTDQLGPGESSRLELRSEIVYFYIFSQGKAWTTNLAVAAYRRSDFSLISFNLLLTDLKEFLTTRGYYRQQYKTSDEKEGVRIPPSFFEQSPTNQRHFIWRPRQAELEFPYFFDLWCCDGKVYQSTKAWIDDGRAIGLQYVGNWRTHELLVHQSKIVAYQFTKSEHAREITEVLDSQSLRLDDKLKLTTTGQGCKIGGKSYVMPFYSDDFPYILAPDDTNHVQLINTRSGHRLSLIRLRKTHQFDALSEFSFTVIKQADETGSFVQNDVTHLTLNAKDATTIKEEDSVLTIDAIVIHFKEALHSPKGEVLSISYNQLVLDKVVLQVLVATDARVPRTREEFGNLYIEKFRHDREFRSAVEQLERKRNKLRHLKKRHIDHDVTITELQAKCQQTEEQMGVLERANNEQEALIKRLQDTIRRNDARLAEQEACCALF